MVMEKTGALLVPTTIFVLTCFMIMGFVMVYRWSECTYKNYVSSGTYNSNYNAIKDFENFDNETGTSSGVYIVPNIVHFIRFGTQEMQFMEAVCVLAALRNQRPEKLVIHTDNVEQGGKYWDVVIQHPSAQGVLEVRFLCQPKSIFGQPLSQGWRAFHAADVARLEVLMAEGGIFLDRDSYIVRNLNPFRRFEMTLGWMNSGISNQVIIAHKNARFLRNWYKNYKEYHGSSWFYNAGEKPSIILRKRPHLVHRVRRFLAEWGPWHWRMIYVERSKDWVQHYAIHLMTGWKFLMRQRWSKKIKHLDFADELDERSILLYRATIQDMALAVYPYPIHINDSSINQ